MNPRALEDLREYLGLIRSEAFRCKAITNGLLDFSHSRTLQHVPVNLGEVVYSAFRLVSHQQRGEMISLKSKRRRACRPFPAMRGSCSRR